MTPSSVPMACREASECFLRLVPDATEPELLRLCAAGLDEISKNYEHYQATVTTASSFMKELAEAVRELCSEKDASAERQHDRAFMLMEALVLVMREVTLREGTQQSLPVQDAIMRYFEESGHWHWNEPTLVAEYYYIRIPIAVMHSLVALISGLVHGGIPAVSKSVNVASV